MPETPTDTDESCTLRVSYIEELNLKYGKNLTRLIMHLKDPELSALEMFANGVITLRELPSNLKPLGKKILDRHPMSCTALFSHITGQMLTRRKRAEAILKFSEKHSSSSATPPPTPCDWFEEKDQKELQT